MSFSSLDISAPKDGMSWIRGCKQRLGMREKSSIISETPSVGELAEFFGKTPDWIYLSGHFGNKKLSNNLGVAPVVDIVFSYDSVEVIVGSEHRKLVKHWDFQLHQECTLVVWAGCSALKHDTYIKSFRQLFDNPVLLGYAAQTGWRISDAMLGGGFITNDFFARVKNKMAQNDRHAERKAWMETAAWGYGGGECEGMFRAVDQDGQEWRLDGKRVVPGPKH
jgi:hypothetical protein